MILPVPDMPPLNEGHAALVRLIVQGGDTLTVQCEPFGGAMRDDPGCKWAPPARPAWYWRAWDWMVFGLGLVQRPQ